MHLHRLWHLKHGRNGGVWFCFRTESSATGLGTGSGAFCSWRNSFLAGWREERLVRTSVTHGSRKVATARRTARHWNNSRPNSYDWFPSTRSPRPVSDWNCFLGCWTATHVFLWQMWCDLHLNLIMAFALPPFCPMWTLAGALPSGAMEGCKWASPAHAFCRNSQLLTDLSQNSKGYQSRCLTKINSVWRCDRDSEQLKRQMAVLEV